MLFKMAFHFLPSKTSWHPSYLEAVPHQTQCPESPSTADTIVNQRNAHKSGPKEMFETSEERLRGNTSHSATECFPRWPHTFYLPTPPGTLAIYCTSTLHQFASPDAPSRQCILSLCSPVHLLLLVVDVLPGLRTSTSSSARC